LPFGHWGNYVTEWWGLRSPPRGPRAAPDVTRRGLGSAWRKSSEGFFWKLVGPGEDALKKEGTTLVGQVATSGWRDC